MRLLLYKDLDLRRVKPAFDKVRAAIEADDFRSADVKKLNAGSLPQKLKEPPIRFATKATTKRHGSSSRKWPRA